MSAPTVPWTHRSCFIAWPDRAAADASIHSLRASIATPFKVLGIFDGDDKDIDEEIAAGLDGDVEVYFGLDCDAFSPDEQQFIAAAERLGGTHTGS